jgi:hypothetical protein
MIWRRLLAKFGGNLWLPSCGDNTTSAIWVAALTCCRNGHVAHTAIRTSCLFRSQPLIHGICTRVNKRPNTKCGGWSICLWSRGRVGSKSSIVCTRHWRSIVFGIWCSRYWPARRGEPPGSHIATVRVSRLWHICHFLYFGHGLHRRGFLLKPLRSLSPLRSIL